MSQVDLSVIRSYAAAAVQGLIAATWHDAASCERIALDAFDIAERMAAEEQKRRSDPAKRSIYTA
jgi:hypothetical protein